ncbi:DJ-1/PfpI family protein [Chitinibacter bivalviorum]|uniref:DJ-1/PfpI family protein n=1 Tax=Chitinibacter bivalviorum TaxID=2739434 RepID=A0A7H9BFY1_9NEIS|nr:DJ-1 family glyoxalase III [Chitinibacter bivalviorum]QLG87332.1 DJ-1/PfpI family protein [Chitinibacter bivalviorum]
MTVHVYVAPGFEEVELITIVDVLRRADIDTVMVSLTAGTQIQGAHQISVHADAPFHQVAGQTPELIVLPGGGPGTQALLAHIDLHARLQAQISAGKRVAAICAAPMVLAKIGLLQDKNACCFPGCENTLLDGGANITAYNVVTDGLITTSRGAGTAGLFALELVALLKNEAIAKEVGRTMLYL